MNEIAKPYGEMYRRMLRIRLFEDAAVSLQSRGDIPGGLHTTTGQEATIVGACLALAQQDYMVGTHRSHGHPIGKGAGLNALMAELLAKSTGVNRGKGGSMHLADFSVGSLGETSIVGSGLPTATGAALGAKMQKNGRVSLCFFGDGAASEGTFHESLNIASIWKLPVIYLCENNGYAISTPARDVISVADIASRASSYGMSGHVVDGQNVVEVFDVVSAAVAKARGGDGPSLIEAKTYRFNEHAAGLAKMNYRTDDEISTWRTRDPISLFKAWLHGEAMLDETSLQAIEESVRNEIAAAVDFGLKSSFPEPDEAFDHVFVNPIIAVTI